MGNLVGLHMELRRIDDATTVVDLNGELDAYTAARAKDTMRNLLEGGCRHLILNLRRMDFIDSTGLGVLVSTFRRAREQGSTVRLVSPVHHVRRLFEITRLTYAFPIDASEEEALSNLHRASQ
jgi:anti-sigma B factor antagonist